MYFIITYYSFKYEEIKEILNIFKNKYNTIEYILDYEEYRNIEYTNINIFKYNNNNNVINDNSVISNNNKDDSNNYNITTNHNTNHISNNTNIKIEGIIVLGGDGTLLKTISLLNIYNIPIYPFNLGRVGMLCNLSIKDIDTFINYNLKTVNLISLYNHSDYSDNNRYKDGNREYNNNNIDYSNNHITSSNNHITNNNNLPILTSNKNINYNDNHITNYNKNIVNNFINEVLFTNEYTGYLNKYKIIVDGRIIDIIYCDSIMVSTSLGSTGYNKSTNGPIIIDYSNNICDNYVSDGNKYDCDSNNYMSDNNITNNTNIYTNNHLYQPILTPNRNINITNNKNINNSLILNIINSNRISYKFILSICSIIEIEILSNNNRDKGSIRDNNIDDDNKYDIITHTNSNTNIDNNANQPILTSNKNINNININDNNKRCTPVCIVDGNIRIYSNKYKIIYNRVTVIISNLRDNLKDIYDKIKL